MSFNWKQFFFIQGYPTALPTVVRTRPETQYWLGHAVNLPNGKYSTKATRSAPTGSFDSSAWESYPQQFNDLCEPDMQPYLGVSTTGTLTGVSDE